MSHFRSTEQSTVHIRENEVPRCLWYTANAAVSIHFSHIADDSPIYPPPGMLWLILLRGPLIATTYFVIQCLGLWAILGYIWSGLDQSFCARLKWYRIRFIGRFLEISWKCRLNRDNFNRQHGSSDIFPRSRATSTKPCSTSIVYKNTCLISLWKWTGIQRRVYWYRSSYP